MDERKKAGASTPTTTVTRPSPPASKTRRRIVHKTAPARRGTRPALTAKEEQVLRMHYGIAADPDMPLEFEGQDFEATRRKLAEIELRALQMIQAQGGTKRSGKPAPSPTKSKIIEKLRGL